MAKIKEDFENPFMLTELENKHLFSYISIQKKGKKRNLTTYLTANYNQNKIFLNAKEKNRLKIKLDESNRIKESHKKINKKLNTALRNIPGSELGFAFNGKHLFESASKHVDNYYFFKFDFHNFFDCLSIEGLAEYSYEDLNINKNEFEDLCAGGGEQGLITSPVIANLIMIEFDKTMNIVVKQLLNKYCYYDIDENKAIYSRYADDILISFPKEIIDRDLFNSDIEVRKQLNKIKNEIKKNIKITTSKLVGCQKLRLNHSKTNIISFDKVNHIKILSWNIIKGKNGMPNYITAGRKATKRGLYGYQKHGIKNCSQIKLQK